MNANEKRQSFINKVKKRSKRARSASRSRKLDELAEQHSKRAQNSRAKRLFLEVSGRRKKNTLQVVGASPFFHKNSSTLQSNFCESLRKIGPELRSGQLMAGHPKKLQKRPFSRASGGRSRDAFKLVRSSSKFHKSSTTLQSNFCESLRKIGQELRSRQPLAGHELFVGKQNG